MPIGAEGEKAGAVLARTLDEDVRVGLFQGLQWDDVRRETVAREMVGDVRAGIRPVSLRRGLAIEDEYLEPRARRRDAGRIAQSMGMDIADFGIWLIAATLALLLYVVLRFVKTRVLRA